ncbi:MAG: flavodoxin family protein [Coriobacteriales bacterium]|nr:flavodoxin family protein [Coriobacteriales bacterium]
MGYGDESMKKIVVINASPRADGNCSAIEGILSKELHDAELDIIDFRNSNIDFCQACNWCSGQKKPTCIQKDDMAALLPKIDACDAFVLLSPIYYAELCAQAKVIVDRMYPFFNPAVDGMSTASKFGKKFALITTCGDPDGAYDDYTANVAKNFPIAGFDECETLCFGGGNEPGAVTEDDAKVKQVCDLAGWLLR